MSKQSKKSVQKATSAEQESNQIKSEETFNKVKPYPTEQELQKKKRKKRVIIIVVVILLLIAAGCGGVAAYFLIFNQPTEKTIDVEEPAPEEEKPKIYSKLSGLQISDESENALPTYCIQVPNGADGARPQVGLNEAPVVFEAVAEAGITRFAAIFQNPKSHAIGPIRSLRNYYLDWDTPFDCTIVHAGGSDTAIQALRAGNYRDLNESLVYMWRDSSAYWAPNNLFTSADLLNKFNKDSGYTSSEPKVFPRLTPTESADLASKNVDSARQVDETSGEVTFSTNLLTEFQVNFGYVSTFNTVYQYDISTNTYKRSYATGEEHLVYNCADSDRAEPRPKQDCGTAIQIAPSAVAVMMVDERKASDGYHENIQTIGTGIAYIFQNGSAVKGTWRKTSQSAQIEFMDAEGNAIAFNPGQLWIAAVPNYGGSVKY